VDKAQEFVIGGYTPDNPLDALLVGYYERDKLIFASKVRNGFVPRLRREVWANERSRDESMSLLQSPRDETHAMDFDARGNEKCVWLKPLLVAQIEFTE
jgi:ATP-dependent DNA ligase